MKTTINKIALMIFALCFTTISSAQFQQFVSKQQNQTPTQFPIPGSESSNTRTINQAIQENNSEQTLVQHSPQNLNHAVKPSNGIIVSPAPVPSDLVNITGRWINEKNNCIAAVQWDGEKWLGTALPESHNPLFNYGEIILELYPKSETEVYGRMMVVKKKGKIEWKDVKYKLSLTKMKGSYEWKFYRK